MSKVKAGLMISILRVVEVIGAKRLQRLRGVKQVQPVSRAGLTGGLLMLCLSFAGTAWSISEKAFFHEEVQVHSTAIETALRAQVIQEALSSVLVRLSGDRMVLEQPPVKRALKNASRYLLSYSTETTSNRFINDHGESVPITRVLIDFDPQAVEDILKSAQLPIWDLERPPVMFWWIIDDGPVRGILGNQSSGSDADVRHLKQAAHRYGLAVELPLMDIEDQKHVRTATIAGFMLDDLVVASRRYGADYMVVGRSSRTAAEPPWKATWQFVSPAGVELQEAQADSLEALFYRVNESIAVTMSKQFAVVINADEQQSAWLEVSQIASLAIYDTILRYLEGLPVIGSVRLANVSQGQLCYELGLKSDPSQLRRILSQSRKLIEQTSLIQPPVDGPILSVKNVQAEVVASVEGAQETEAAETVADSDAVAALPMQGCAGLELPGDRSIMRYRAGAF